VHRFKSVLGQLGKFLPKTKNNLMSSNNKTNNWIICVAHKPESLEESRRSEALGSASAIKEHLAPLPKYARPAARRREKREDEKQQSI